MNEDVPALLHQPPEPDLVAPRDGRKILFTKDFHFIARTLDTWSNGIEKLWEIQSAEASSADYYLQDSSGRLLNPLSGDHTERDIDTKSGEFFSHPESLYRHLIEDFFYLRCLLTKRCKTDLTLCFQGNPLLHAGEPLGPELDHLNSLLSHPVSIDDDPILDHLHSLRFPAPMAP